MKNYIICSVFLFAFQSLFANAEGDQTAYKFPSLQPVKPIPDFKSYDSECQLKKKENPQLYSINMSINYPVVLNRIEQEGWVVLSYDIIQGKVGNINVVDSSPDKSFPENSFERYAINDLKRSKIIGYDGDIRGCIAKMQYHLKD